MNARIASLGGIPVAQHKLSTPKGPVDVRFLALGARVIELFDEGPFTGVVTDRRMVRLATCLTMIARRRRVLVAGCVTNDSVLCLSKAFREP